MPSWQWSYPFDAADTATLLFDTAPASPLCRWSAPHQDVPAPRQVLVETADGGVRSYKLGSVGRLVVLQFAGLPAGADEVVTQLWGWLGLVRFLDEFTDFSQRTFGLFDHAGAAEAEMRYVEGIETFRLSQGRYAGHIALRAEIV